MSGNLQYVVDNNQKIMLAHCACWPLVFHKHRLQCRCIFLDAILTDWIQMTKKAFATKKLSFLSIMRLEFQNVFQACMHVRIKLWQFSLFLFLPVSFSGLLFACLHLREVSTQISREVNSSTKQKKVLMTPKGQVFLPFCVQGSCISNYLLIIKSIVHGKGLCYRWFKDHSPLTAGVGANGLKILSALAKIKSTQDSAFIMQKCMV